MKRGTIILTPFPLTDLSKNKVRPALIVSSDNRSGEDIIIAFITSVIDSEKLIRTDILIESEGMFFKETGLKTSSIIRTDKLATIDKKIILGELGYLHNETIEIINDMLKVVLDLD